MKTTLPQIGAPVNVSRAALASSLAASLPEFVYWNPGTVCAIARKLFRVQVQWPGSAQFWFDADALSAHKPAALSV